MSIVLLGSTSGSCTLQEQAVAGTTVLTLPAVSGTILTTTSPKAGNVIQVVQSLIAGKASTTSTSLTKLVTSASITPSSSTSKILVSVFSPLGNDNTGNADFAIIRTVSATDTNLTGTVFNRQSPTQAYGQPSWAWSLLDSPSTTSAITYSVSALRTDGNATPFCGGRATDSTYETGTMFILQEIAA